MENVFENAYFGKAYLTRDGRKAIYMGSNCDSHLAVIEGTPYIWEYRDDGTLDENLACSNDRTMDIVSEWKDSQFDSEKMRLTGIVKQLWDIIDDIDSFADNCIKDASEDNPFRVILRKCGERHEIVNTDGYDLFFDGEKI